MKLEELLDELRGNILRDVSDEVGGQNGGALWSDRTLVRYIEDGVVRFAVQTCCLRDDTTPELTQITLQAGVDQYALDPRVIAVLSARFPGAYFLSRTTYGGLFSNRGDVTIGNPIADKYNGCPRRFYTDRQTGYMGVFPVPRTEDEGSVVQLRVARKPLAPLTTNDLKAVPEIPEEYQLDVLDWAAYRALRNHDADAENMAKANSHKKRFEDTVVELSRQAKRLLAQDIQFDLRANWER